MSLSILYPIYRRPELLYYGLQSVLKQTINFDFEIIVLDEGTMEDGIKYVCDSYKDKLNIRYIHTGANKVGWRIPGVAFNMGAKLSTTDILILACPEIYLMENTILQQYYDILKKSRKTMVISYGKDDRDELFLNSVRQQKSHDDLLKIYNSNKMYELNTEFPFFLGIDKQGYIDIGGYDEDFLYCWDDLDFVEREQYNGYKYVKIEGKVVHLYHSRSRTDLKDKENKWNYSKKLYETRRGIIKRNTNKN